MAEHIHLDRQRRDRGECPACDEAWVAQDERLGRTDPRTKANRQLDQLVDQAASRAAREAKLAERRYGKRALDDG